MDCRHAYQRYAAVPNLRHAQLLLGHILKTSEIYNLPILKYNSFEESLILCTNGSTNSGRSLYGFGPFAKFWICEIERYLKGNHIAHTVTLNIENIFSHILKPTPKLTSTPDYALSKSQLTIDLKDPVVFSESILKLHTEHGLINLLTTPSIALFLLTNKHYRSLIDYHSTHINSIITINTDPFYPSHIIMRDQMINWQTGFNYYICQYKNTHILPLFTTDLRNALNAYANKVASPPSCDDLIQFRKNGYCRCGKMTYNLKYIPHIHNQIKKDGMIIRPFDIANKLSSCYYSLQFEQKKNDIIVHYVTKDNNLHDLEMIYEYFKQYNFNVVLSSNTIFKVGQKQPAFWNGENIIVSEVDPHV
jgi:hypothetical protein